MIYQFSFEKLEVWQTARLLVGNIYLVTRNFPESERFGLTNQMRRAANSVCANLSRRGNQAIFQRTSSFYFNRLWKPDRIIKSPDYFQ